MLSALILFLVIGLLPFFVREFRSNTRILLAYWFVIVLHQIIAFVNSFLFLTIGGAGDAESFHYNGGELALTGDFVYSTGSVLYENILGVIYWLFGPSKLLGAQFSILAFAVSCVILLKILRLLGFSSYRVSVLLLFGSLPSMVCFGSVTLRESYEILFFMLTIYFGIKMYVVRGVNVYFVFMIASALLMGLLHRGLIVYAVLLIALFMMWTPYTSSSLLNINKRTLTITLIMSASMLGVILLAKAEIIHLGAMTSVPELGLLGVVSQFRKIFSTMDSLYMARASYNVVGDFSSPVLVVRTFFVMYSNFLFAPFPWQINNFIDMAGSVESIFRMILIYCSVKHWRNTHGMQRRFLGLMLLLFFSMSFFWSLGTSNYGTAARHNLLTWWILSITGTPMLMRMLSRIGLMAPLKIARKGEE